MVDQLPRYGVQAAHLSEAIHVGRIHPSGERFSDKEDATDMVLGAVAQYVLHNFALPDRTGGAMETTFPRQGLALRVTVTPIEEDE